MLKKSTLFKWHRQDIEMQIIRRKNPLNKNTQYFYWTDLSIDFQENNKKKESTIILYDG